MKKHLWHVFRHEKLFEKQPQPHCQASSMSTITCFYSFLAIFGTLSLTLFIFRVICSTHLSFRYKSLVYRLLSMKSIFFKLVYKTLFILFFLILFSTTE
jgi:hypothetical protein